ncbi:HEPN domain-containing protein [Candidatus Saganbacteria bacterium]|nr:HEPN domain-containing protein [Candidatus Saganbacteria bacterium]
MFAKSIKEQIEYWLKSAHHDLETAEALFTSQHYDWCLFLAHLVIEKVLKAYYVRDNNAFPPKIHKLDYLAEKTKLSLPVETINFLKEINDFNLEARYPDNKFQFYKLCTRKFTEIYFSKIKDLYKWLLKEIKI